MIDLDAIKAAGLNSNEASARLLAQHEYQERVRLYLDLCRGFADANPLATSEEVEQHRQCAALQAGI